MPDGGDNQTTKGDDENGEVSKDSDAVQTSDTESDLDTEKPVSKDTDNSNDEKPVSNDTDDSDTENPVSKDTDKAETETDTDRAIESTCSEEGALRCAAAGGVSREKCLDGIWVEAKPCEEGTACNMGDTENPGECISAAEICKGGSGENVCQGPVMYQCGKNAIILKSEKCDSERLCQLGASSGKCATCIPSTYICNDAELKECNEKGDAYSLKKTCATKALCNATVGACTKEVCLPDTWECTSGDKLRRCNEDQTGLEDVKQCDDGMCDVIDKQCDVCIPGSVRCEDDAVITCDSDGQNETEKACPSNKRHCIGQGNCVQCRVDKSDCPQGSSCNPEDNTCVDCLDDEDCPKESDCMVGYCTYDNKCGTEPAPKNTRCGGGYRITSIETIESIALLLMKQKTSDLPFVEVDQDFRRRETYLEGYLTDQPDLSVYENILEEDNE